MLTAVVLEPLIAFLAPFAAGFAYPLPLTGQLPLQVGPGKAYVSDVILAAALLAALLRLFLLGRRERPHLPATPVLGLPFLLFAAVLVEATVRGHERYGQSLLGAPTRLAAYAGIGAIMLWLRPRAAYRGLVAVFYAGASWQALVGVYLLATGGSETTLSPISTGGHRVIAGSTSMLICGSLLLALLNVRRETLARRQAIHVLVVVLSAVGLALSFQRTTFATIAVLVPVFLLFLRGLPTRALAALPLAAPLLVVVVLLTTKAAPDVLPMLGRRLSADPSTDVSFVWREQANHAVFAQVRESPFFGVGFGRDAVFEYQGVPQAIHQDPHNQYLYLWAGGGLLLLGSWALLMASYVWDALRRLRTATGAARSLIIWSLSMWFVLSVNAGTGVVLVDENSLLVFWAVLLLPAFAAPRPQEPTVA